jgi:ABC-type multidrug transport system fused ATPase/permease subunit
VKTASKIRELLSPAERRGAVGLLALMVVGMVLETLGIGLVIPVVALLLQGDVAVAYPQLAPLLARLGNPTHAQLVVGGMLVLVAIYLVKTIFLGFLAWRQTKFAFDVQTHLSQQLFGIYLHQPYTFHLERNSAELIRNIVTEVEQFARSAVTPALSLITEGLVLLGIATLLLIVEPVGAVIMVAVVGSAAWAFHRGTRARVARWGLARQVHEGLRIQHLQQGLGGVKEVKLLGREPEFLDQYRTHNARSARAGQMQNTLLLLPRLWLELLAVVGLTSLVLTMLFQRRDATGILPTLAVFAAAAFRLMPSVNRALNAVQSLRFGLPVIDTLHEEIHLAIPSLDADRGPSVTFQHEVRVCAVSYSYPMGPGPVLEGIDLDIEKGQFIGFIGPSGSGKSTLIDIIVGLLAPTVGSVRVDGRDVRQCTRGWQDHIGYVPQSVYLTDDTLRRNVAFGLRDEEIDDSAVLRALAAAQLDELAIGQSEGINALVGERGIRLSGGQRQRIGIARALYHDPPVLVLDEATSALDTDTESGVMQAVMALHGVKTILVVAHRLSTVRHCDRLYQLEKGKLIACGTPAAILASRPDEE